MQIRIQKQPAHIEQFNVILALLKRELATRFGKYQLGLFWLLLEPLSTVIMLGLILGPVIGRSSGEIPYAFFLLCGYTQLKNFTTPLSSGINAISANEGLLVFRQVEPIDPFIARFIFSFVSIVLSFLVFCFIGVWLGIELSFSRLGLLALCFIITWLMGCGLGLAVGIKAVKMKELEKVIQYTQQPLMFLSCVFIPLTSLPKVAQDVLLLNPLVHTVELLRHSLFPIEYPMGRLSIYYPMAFALVFLALGMMVYRNNRHYLKQR